VELYSDLFAGRSREVTRRVSSVVQDFTSNNGGDSETDYESLTSEPTSQHESESFQDPPLDSCRLPVRFCYDGPIADYLNKDLERDVSNSEHSSSFRAFYKLRPLIPARLRQWAQARRNRSLASNPRWYIPEGLERVVSELDEPLQSIWPEQAEYALVLTHDVEEQMGFDNIFRVAELEERLGLRSCWNIVPYKYRVDKGVIRELQQRGHEVAVHGYNHDGRLFLSKKIFDSRVTSINQVASQWNARGFRSPMVHRNLTWMQSLQFEYDSSCFDIDPFQAMPGGVGGIWPFEVGNLVELPYTLPQDHTLFVTLKENSTRIWRDKLQFLRKHHGMALMLTHPDYFFKPIRTI
jgi:peptidoglycan/xylan/chitin deacetylase (PgdA/CDA1 family)